MQKQHDESVSLEEEMMSFLQSEPYALPEQFWRSHGSVYQLLANYL